MPRIALSTSPPGSHPRASVCRITVIRHAHWQRVAEVGDDEENDEEDAGHTSANGRNASDSEVLFSACVWRGVGCALDRDDVGASDVGVTGLCGGKAWLRDVPMRGEDPPPPLSL